MRGVALSGEDVTPHPPRFARRPLPQGEVKGRRAVSDHSEATDTVPPSPSLPHKGGEGCGTAGIGGRGCRMRCEVDRLARPAPSPAKRGRSGRGLFLGGVREGVLPSSWRMPVAEGRRAGASASFTSSMGKGRTGAPGEGRGVCEEDVTPHPPRCARRPLPQGEVKEGWPLQAGGGRYGCLRRGGRGSA